MKIRGACRIWDFVVKIRGHLGEEMVRTTLLRRQWGAGFQSFQVEKISGEACVTLQYPCFKNSVGEDLAGYYRS